MQKLIGPAISGAVSGAVFSVLASGLVLTFVELGRITWSGPATDVSDDRVAALHPGGRSRTLADR